MADPTLGLPSYNPQVPNPNMRMMLGNMAMSPVVAPAAFGGVGGVIAPPAVQRNPWLPDSAMTPADTAYYRAAAQPLTAPPPPVSGPGTLAAAQGIAPNGFPVAQPGQGGTLSGVWQQALAANGAQAGIPQPQPVGARMMGTADPLAGYPGFTNGTGAPAGFGVPGAPAAPPRVAALPSAPPAATNAVAPITTSLQAHPDVPDGGRLVNLPSAGTPPTMSNLPAFAGSGGGGLTNPSGAIANGYDQQLSYQRNALNNIMSAAAQGSPNNYSFRLGHLVGAMGQNNFAQVQGQGADALNQSIASEADAGMAAGASMYGADQGLERERVLTREQHYQAATGGVQTGGTVDRSGPYPIVVPTFGARPQVAGGMPTPYNPQAPTALPAGLRVGAPTKQADGDYSAGGKTVTVKNGVVAGIQ